MQTIVDFYMLHRPRKCVLSVVVILLLSMGNLFTQTALAAPVNMKPHTQTTTFTLDGVTVTVDTPFLPASHFSTSKSGDATQTAVAATSDPKVHPYGAISITAVPFGTKPKSEGVPIAQAGGAATYRAFFQQYRLKAGDNPQPGPVVTLFGQLIQGETSLLQTANPQDSASSVVIEWVVEAGNRLWIMRMTQELPIGNSRLSSTASLLSSLNAFSVSSTTLNHHSTISTMQYAVISHAASSNIDNPPPWWNGSPCDDAWYKSQTGVDSYQLGTAHYHGIIACGPRPAFDGVPDERRYFGGSSALEWECMELSLRYLYLGYGIAPYGDSAKNLVSEYSGTALNKVNNQTVGQMPQPGDVLSYNIYANGGGYTANGHTSLVISQSNVDMTNGNETIVVLQQNAGTVQTVVPTETLTVTHWNVTYAFGVVINWLHDPNSGGSNGGLPSALQSATPTLITFSGGQRELVAVGSDGHIWHTPIAATDTGTWGPWNWMGSTGGFANATPTLMTFADGQRELIAVGQDGHIWHTPVPATDTGTWGAWNWTGSTGGFAAASPTVITYADGSLELVAVSQDGHIWHTPQGLTDTGVWGQWDWLGSAGGFAAASPTLIKYANGSLELIAVGQDGHIWHDPIPSVDNGTWGRWDWLGSTGGFAAASPTLIKYANGSLELIAVGQDGHIWHDPIPAIDNGTWGAWNWTGSTGGFTNASPMLITYADGTLELTAISQDGHIWHEPIPAIDNGTWGQWDWLGSTGGFTNASPILIPFSNGWELIAIGQDGHVWHDPIPTVDNGTWGRWDWLGSTGGFV